MLLGEISIYQEVFALRRRWDQQLPETMLKKWNAWKNNLPRKIVVPRAFRLQQEKIEAIDFQACK